MSGRVLFEVESVDRVYLNVYQPRLQYGGGVLALFAGHRGRKYASSVLMAPITETFAAKHPSLRRCPGTGLVVLRQRRGQERHRAQVPG